MRFLAFSLVLVGGLVGIMAGWSIVWLAAVLVPVGPQAGADSSDNSIFALVGFTSMLAAASAIVCAFIWITGKAQWTMPKLIALFAAWHWLAAFIFAGTPGFVLMCIGAWLAWTHPATPRGRPPIPEYDLWRPTRWP